MSNTIVVDPYESYEQDIHPDLLDQRDLHKQTTDDAKKVVL